MLIVSAAKEYIFEDDRPFESCHASTLISLGGDEILAAWFGGTAEGKPDVDIWAAERSGAGWSEPRRIAASEEPLWNPVLFRDEDGLITLYYKTGHTIPGWRTMVTRSNDRGGSWTTPKELVEGDEGGRGPVKNKPIRLSSGVLAAPASIETKARWDAFVDLSSDNGASWTRTELVPLRRAEPAAPGEEAREAPPPGTVVNKGVIQPTLWESAPGQVHMLLRSTDDYMFRSDSADGGETWGEAYAIGLPNNNSGIDLARMDDGLLALAYNPVAGRRGARTPLVVRFSIDNGANWDAEFVLEDEPGEYSYPAIVASGDELHIAYTWKRERIAYWKLVVGK
ncbi:neuraminidase (sialidase) [Paenibacillus hemerocallicola]|uniref:Neuraminidase (Sialidase) n=1 Tax=Paenibacillus hemerocallicola TaxID=1172614 RepID=A0A5C4TAI2_9BACL|nr:sialidase family protein [Paenibacillus hemerocallicola]TNJ65610.1 neuraminidase (sialidase) [Paenibacillus hemerocallicola]